MTPGGTSARHLTVGEEAEQLARQQLESRGMKVVDRNFRCPMGELDLVMMDGEVLVFVEVRYRRNDRFGGAAASIDSAKQRKLNRAAEFYLQQNQSLAFRECRFDVMAVSGTGGKYQFDWISDAF